ERLSQALSLRPVQYEEGTKREPPEIVPGRERHIFRQQSPDAEHKEGQWEEEFEIKASGGLSHAGVECSQGRWDAASQGCRGARAIARLAQPLLELRHVKAGEKRRNDL